MVQHCTCCTWCNLRAPHVIWKLHFTLPFTLDAWLLQLTCRRVDGIKCHPKIACSLGIGTPRFSVYNAIKASRVWTVVPDFLKVMSLFHNMVVRTSCCWSSHYITSFLGCRYDMWYCWSWLWWCFLIYCCKSGCFGAGKCQLSVLPPACMQL